MISNLVLLFVRWNIIEYYKNDSHYWIQCV